MDSKEKFETFDNGYKEGYLMAAQQVASKVLRLIDDNPSWMLKTDRERAKTHIKLSTKYLLQHRGIIPYTYDVLTGKKDDVPLDFNIDC